MLYVPILKFKQGEKDALYTLQDGIKNHIIPLLEVDPNVMEKKRLTGLDTFWYERPFIFDIPLECYEEITDDEYFELLKKLSTPKCIPVIRLEDSNEKVKKISSYANNGLALRIYTNEITDEDFDDIYTELTSLIDPAITTLIIDNQFVEPAEFNNTAFLVKSIVNMIDNLDKFEKVVFASNSFPSSLTGINKHELVPIVRNESKLYEKVKPYFEKKGIDVIYSDYGINHWGQVEYIKGMQVSFNIRYTKDDYYIIFKGDTTKKGGFKINKVREACTALVQSPCFFGSSYSWGDNEILEKGNGETDKPGNSTSWRAIGNNHHITFIVNLLSNQS